MAKDIEPREIEDPLAPQHIVNPLWPLRLENGELVPGDGAE